MIAVLGVLGAVAGSGGASGSAAEAKQMYSTLVAADLVSPGAHEDGAAVLRDSASLPNLSGQPSFDFRGADIQVYEPYYFSITAFDSADEADRFREYLAEEHPTLGAMTCGGKVVVVSAARGPSLDSMSHVLARYHCA